MEQSEGGKLVVVNCLIHKKIKNNGELLDVPD